MKLFTGEWLGVDREARRLAVLPLVAALACIGCGDAGPGPPVVVVYTSLDQHYSQPVLAAFEEQTGIQVRARYDTEADKTTGLYNRLVEERANPRCDVFWNSEVLRTVLLARAGLLAPYRSPRAGRIGEAYRGRNQLWTGFAGRLRVFIYNTDLVRPEDAPKSLEDLADPRWRGRACMALPLAGTTQTHIGALWAVLGPERARALLRRLVGNDIRIVNGNAVVRDLVARGEMHVGVTDTDDANEGLRRGDPIAMSFPGTDSPGAFLIPNTVALVRGAPHPREARTLIDFLLSAETESMLARSGSVQIPLGRGLGPPPGLPDPSSLPRLEVSYESAARGVEESEPFLRELFLR